MTFGRVSEWSNHWGMKLNVGKTKTKIVSRSHTMHYQSPPLIIGGTVLKQFLHLWHGRLEASVSGYGD